GGQCGELAVKDFGGVGFFVILKGVPIGHDSIMVVRSPGSTEGSFGGEKAGELEYLPGDESSFVAAVGFFDYTAHFPSRQLHIVECDAGFKLHGVEQHFCPEWNCNRTEHVILLHNTRSFGERAVGKYDAT